MVRFLHTGDWQLGMTRHFLGADAQAVFTHARLDAIRTLGRVAEQHGCAFVVVAGDVFESNQVERPVVAGALAAMAAAPDVRWYLLPGNHDPLDAGSVFRSPTFRTHAPDNVVVLDAPGVVPVAPGIELVAAPWTTKKPLADLLGQVVHPLSPASEVVRVAVGHGAVDALSPDRTDPAVIGLDRLHRAIDGGAVHYVALGDRHSTTPVGDSGRVWYAGAPEPTDHDEVDPGNAVVVELDHHRCHTTVVPIGTWRFADSRVELTTRADVDRLADWLASHADPARTIVRLSLVGQLSLDDAAHLDHVLDHHRDLLAALSTWERHTDLVVVPDGSDIDRLAVSGFARDTLDELMAASTDPSAPDATADALALLYRLAATP